MLLSCEREHALIRRLTGGACLICPPVPDLGTGEPRSGTPQTVRSTLGTVAQAAAIAARARAELSRRDSEEASVSLAAFTRQGWHVIRPAVRLEWGDHVEALCLHVQGQLEERARAVMDPTYVIRGQRLGINIPPRSLKTLIVQVFATAWAWIRWPDLKIGCLSANAKMLTIASREFRELITSDWYRDSFAPQWTIKDDQDQVLSIGNTAGGSRSAIAFGAKIIGQGFDWMQIDDPHDAEDTSKEIEAACDKWDTSLGNRIESPRTTIFTLIMQRLRERDLSGHFRALGGWCWVVLAMLREEKRGVDGEGAQETIYGWRDKRVDGEVLHPRFTPEFLATERTRLGPYGWAGQMQQRPAPVEGGLVKLAWLRFCRFEQRSYSGTADKRQILDKCAPALRTHGGSRPRRGECNAKGELDGCTDDPARVIPLLDWIAIVVDPSGGSVNPGASRVGLLVVGGAGADRFVLEDRSREMSYLEQLAAIEKAREDFPTASKILIEKAAAGQCALGESLAAAGVPGVKSIPTGRESKEDRLNMCIPEIDAGNLYLLDGAPWLAEFIGELCTFPAGDHDDRVDALTLALNETRKKAGSRLLDAWKM